MPIVFVWVYSIPLDKHQVLLLCFQRLANVPSSELGVVYWPVVLQEASLLLGRGADRGLLSSWLLLWTGIYNQNFLTSEVCVLLSYAGQLRFSHLIEAFHDLLPIQSPFNNWSLALGLPTCVYDLSQYFDSATLLSHLLRP